MKDYAPKLAPVAAQVLQPGEQLLAAVRTQPTGGAAAGGAAGATAAQFGAIGAVVGLAATVASEARRSSQQQQATGPEALLMAVLALTDRRLLAWQRAPLTGKTGRFLNEIPLPWIRSMTGKQAGKLAPHGSPLIIDLTNGLHLELEAFKLDDLPHFLSTFERLSRSSS